MKTVHLLKVADSVVTAPQRFVGEKSYFATGDVDGSELGVASMVTFEDRPSRANLTAKPGDVLFAKMQSTPKVLHVTESDSNAVFSTGFCNLRPKGLLASRYLFHFLKSPIFQHAKDTRCTGATQKALTLAALREIEIPLPERVDEQHRIAALLDKAASTRHKCEHALTLADDFLRSTFLEMFGDPLTNVRGLPTQALGGFGKIVTGNTPPRSDPGNFGDSIEWIKSDNVNTNEHFLTQAVEGLSDKGRMLGRIVPKGSILVTCIAGSPSSIGRAAIANRPVAFNQQINAIVPNPDVNVYFLYVQFLVGKQLVLRSSTNSMKGMISKGEFQKIEFLKPDTDEQARFGRLFEKHVAANNRLLNQKVVASDLFESLSQRAFAGDL